MSNNLTDDIGCSINVMVLWIVLGVLSMILATDEHLMGIDDSKIKLEFEP